MSDSVLAKDAKAGQWYESGRGNRLLCIEGRLVVNRRGTASYLLDIAPLTHLPDCTGWDWQQPKLEKKYRAFATWQEWWPHRHRLYRDRHRAISHVWVDDAKALKDFNGGAVFLNDDGSAAEPFGVEVTA